MLQRSSTERTAEVFFASPTKKQYLMDISRSISLAHTSVKKNLDILVKTGIVKESVERKGSRKFPLYTANRESSLFRKQKILYNLSIIFQSQLIEFIEETFAPKAVVLFGSFQRGEDSEDSDIDLFFECKKKNVDVRRFEKKLGRKIELHFNEHFETYQNELKNNIINGITLSGFLEGYR